MIPLLVALLTVSASNDSALRALYAIDKLGNEHYLGAATSLSMCELAGRAALIDRPTGIKGLLGPGPWKFECRPENRFAPGWDRIKGR